MLDEFVQEARGWWRVIDALPAGQRQRLAADAWAGLAQRIDELATLDVDAAVAELRELTARAPETAPPPDRDSRGGGDGDDDAWYDRPYLEPL